MSVLGKTQENASTKNDAGYVLLSHFSNYILQPFSFINQDQKITVADLFNFSAALPIRHSYTVLIVTRATRALSLSSMGSIDDKHPARW